MEYPFLSAIPSVFLYLFIFIFIFICMFICYNPNCIFLKPKITTTINNKLTTKIYNTNSTVNINIPYKYLNYTTKTKWSWRGGEGRGGKNHELRGLGCPSGRG